MGTSREMDLGNGRNIVMVSSPASTNRSQSATPHPTGSTGRPGTRAQASGVESEGSGGDDDAGGDDEDRKDNVSHAATNTMSNDIY